MSGRRIDSDHKKWRSGAFERADLNSNMVLGQEDNSGGISGLIIRVSTTVERGMKNDGWERGVDFGHKKAGS